MRKIGQDLYVVQVGLTKILDRDDTQRRPSEPT